MNDPNTPIQRLLTLSTDILSLHKELVDLKLKVQRRNKLIMDFATELSREPSYPGVVKGDRNDISQELIRRHMNVDKVGS